MKFKVNKESFKKSIAYISGITTENVMLVSANDEKSMAVVEGAGQSVYVRVAMSAEVYAKGLVAVDGQHIGNAKYPSDVVVSYDNNKVMCQSENFKFESPTQQNGGFVRALRPVVDNQVWVTIPRDVLMRAVQASVFDFALKTSADGIVIKVKGDTLVMHAYDSTRASLYTTTLPEQATADIKVVLAPKFFEALRKLPGADDISLGVNGGSLRVRTSTTLLAYPTLQVEPADVETSLKSLIDSSPVTGRCLVSSKRLTSGVATVASVVRGGIGLEDRIKVVIDPEASTLTLTMATDYGGITEVIPVESAEAAAFTLNAKYLMDFLPLMQGDVSLSVVDGRSVLFTSDEGKSQLMIQAVVA